MARNSGLTEGEWRRIRSLYGLRRLDRVRLAGRTFDKKLCRELQCVAEGRHSGTRDEVQGFDRRLATGILRDLGLTIDNGVIVYAVTAARPIYSSSSKVK